MNGHYVYVHCTKSSLVLFNNTNFCFNFVLLYSTHHEVG